MKVLLINPSIKKETQHPLFTSVLFSSAPLGLGYIAAYLRQNNTLDIKIIDEVVTPRSDEEWFREINNIREPLIVGISCLTATYSRGVELANKIKLIKPDTYIVFGGVHPTAVPEESLHTGVVDLVVRNEGEETMKEVCDAFSEGKGLDNIKGISYVKGGNIFHNHPREAINLDILPKFPYDLFEANIKRYSDFGIIFSSRGCPFDCIFCSNRVVTGRAYRTFKINTVVEQIEELVKKYNQRHINFCDDNIVVHKERFFELTDAIIQKGLHKRAYFSAQFRGKDMTEDILEQMRKANFRILACGIETSSERLMKLLNKNETVSDVIKGLRLASSKGFLTSTTFIFGIPTETKQDRINSARLSRKLPLDSARFNIAIPYPGTMLFEIAKQENRLHISPDWRNFNVQYHLFGDDIPYFPKTTGRYTLMVDTMWANLRFYFRLRVILRILLKMDLTGGNVISLQNKKNTFTLYKNLIKIMLFIAERFIFINLRALEERIKYGKDVKKK